MFVSSPEGRNVVGGATNERPAYAQKDKQHNVATMYAFLLALQVCGSSGSFSEKCMIVK